MRKPGVDDARWFLAVAFYLGMSQKIACMVRPQRLLRLAATEHRRSDGVLTATKQSTGFNLG